MMQEEIERAKKVIRDIIHGLLIEQPFFGIWLSRTWIYADPNEESISTDGIRIFVNPKIFGRDFDAEKFIMKLLHVVGHIVFKHVPRGARKVNNEQDAILWHLASDAVLNREMFGDLTLIEEISKKTGVDISELKKMRVEEIFDLLKQNNVSIEPIGQGQGQDHMRFGQKQQGGGQGQPSNQPQQSPQPQSPQTQQGNNQQGQGQQQNQGNQSQQGVGQGQQGQKNQGNQGQGNNQGNNQNGGMNQQGNQQGGKQGQRQQGQQGGSCNRQGSNPGQQGQGGGSQGVGQGSQQSSQGNQPQSQQGGGLGQGQGGGNTQNQQGGGNTQGQQGNQVGQGSQNYQGKSGNQDGQNQQGGQGNQGNQQSQSPQTQQGRQGVGGSGGDSDLIPLNEGDNNEDIRDSNELDPQELERIIDNKNIEIMGALKYIGKLPAWAQRMFEELSKPKIDWRDILRAVLDRAIGRELIKKWNLLNRHFPEEKPGKEYYGIDRIGVLIDTSGSISDTELKQFVTEVYAILSARGVSTVYVIPWDATAYKPVKLTSPGQISRLKTKLMGGGGTVIKPALELAKKLKLDFIIILSDWDIGDIGDAETQKLLSSFKHIIAVTTHSEPVVPKHAIKLRLPIKP